jgi:AMIN domain
MRRALLCLVLLAGPAFAEDPKGPNAEGDYSGVQPGQAKKPESKKAKRPPPKGTLSWIGFESKDGGSEVFFQSVAPFEVSQKVENGSVVVTLSGLTKLGHNTWRPIDTRFFDTPIARVTAKKKGKGIEVRIAFKNAKEAAQGSVRTAAEADGMYYAYVSFAGGGSAAPTSAQPEK